MTHLSHTLPCSSHITNMIRQSHRRLFRRLPNEVGKVTIEKDSTPGIQAYKATVIDWDPNTKTLIERVYWGDDVESLIKQVEHTVWLFSLKR